MRRFASILAAAVALAALPSRARAADPAPAPEALPVTVPVYENRTCPIMGKPASKVMWAETEQGRIYVCCPPCIAKIKQDPARAYAAAYPTVKKAGNAVCPVTGKTLGADAQTIVLQGYEIGLAPGAETLAAAKEDKQVVLAKALNPKVVDVGNRTCPITKKPVVPDAYCLVGDSLIRLSSPEAVAEVKKDPAAALKAAKDSVATPK
jgi:hypothetical protein